ncbi:hypothetical protein FE275_11620 [Pseudomonas koreensis]|nr:hypothetical protein FE275_11620 [Pseudomonas koreensis]
MAGCVCAPEKGWEWACSRRGRHIQHRCRLSGRLREQARSHRGLLLDEEFAAGRNPRWDWWWMKNSGLAAIQGGSGLAHEEAGTLSINVG